MSDPIKLTWGFWPGFIIGTVCGLVVFGIAIIGEGLWDQGIAMGRSLCEGDFARQGMYLENVHE